MELLITILAVVAAVAAFVGSIVGNVVASELYDQCPRLARWLIEKAASRLNDDQRSIRREEWLAHAEASNGKLSALWHAGGCYFAALRLKKEPAGSSSFISGVVPFFDGHRTQTTIRTPVFLKGIGVHSGLPVNLRIGPASIDAGLVFVRTGLEGCDREVGATTVSVISTEFAIVLGDHEGGLVSSPEHVLGALRGMGVDNALIEVDGPEVPIMDGSAAAFVAAIDQAGIVVQSAARRFIQVLKPCRSRSATASARYGPMRTASAPKLNLIS